jgi:YVTN family beta-propeller protein
VTNQNTANVSVIDTSSNTVVATITVGTTPVGVAASPDGTRIYVVNQAANTVSIINTATNTVVGTLPGLAPAPPESLSLRTGPTPM